MSEIPADPAGYQITVADDSFELWRLADDQRVGVYDTREEAVQAAEGDRPTPA